MWTTITGIILFTLYLAGISWITEGNIFLILLFGAGALVFVGFILIPLGVKVGALIILPAMSAAVVTYLNRPSRLIYNVAGSVHTYKWIHRAGRPKEKMRASRWTLRMRLTRRTRAHRWASKMPAIFGGLRIIGIPGIHRLQEFTFTSIVSVTEAGEVQLRKDEHRMVISLRDQEVEQVFNDAVSKNQIRMKVRARLFFRVVDPWRTILAPDDWTTIMVHRVRPTVRQNVAEFDWPELNTAREQMVNGVMRAIHDPNHPMYRRAGADNRTVHQLLQEDYGVLIQAIEFSEIIPTDDDVRNAAEIHYKKEQEARGREMEAVGLKNMAAAFGEPNVILNRRLDIAQKAAESGKLIIVGDGTIHEVLEKIITPRPTT